MPPGVKSFIHAYLYNGPMVAIVGLFYLAAKLAINGSFKLGFLFVVIPLVALCLYTSKVARDFERVDELSRSLLATLAASIVASGFIVVNSVVLQLGENPHRIIPDVTIAQAAMFFGEIPSFALLAYLLCLAFVHSHKM